MSHDVSPLADTFVADPDPDATIPLEIERGASVGRYLVIEPIGAGGMGVVYAAYDPKLDRRVALKALHAASDPNVGNRPLVREAKAMARLSHPNVVTVYDVIVDGDRALVAMELIEGESLRAWLGSSRRTWHQIIEAFLQAGRGLAAAHAAGIIHRDFKLDNVLVGRDGRVRVGDFGLARRIPSLRPPPMADSLEPVSVAASMEAGIAGTPAYMAPDQLRGAPGDESSDQFAFCAALFEALYGTTPFGGTTLLSLRDAMERQQIRPPPAGSQVPRWIRAVLSRGLRARAEERYGSMNELLSALQKDPSARRTRTLVVAVAAIVAVGLGAGVLRARRAEAAQCKALEHQLDGVWDDSMKRGVHDSLVATGRPYAEDTFSRVSRVLDAYTGSWAAQEVAQCDARHKAPTDPLTAPRAECLEQRLSELRAFVSILGHAEGPTVDHAVEGARALPALDVCEGKDPLRGRTWPSDATVRDEAQALVEQLSVAQALHVAGRYEQEVGVAEKNAVEAQRIGFLPLVAEALDSLAEAQVAAGDGAAGAKTFHQATVAAERAGEARIAAKAWIGDAQWEADRGEPALVEDAFDHAEAWIDKVGDDELLRARLWLSHGRILGDQGRFDDSRALLQKSLALFHKHGDEQGEIEATNGLGIDADLQHRYDEANDYYGRVLAWRERVLGPDHPSVAFALNNLGEMEADQGKYDIAIPRLQRALSIAEHAFGPDHPQVGSALSNLAGVYVVTNRLAEALVMAQRALAIAEKAFGPDSPNVAFALASLCGSLLSLDRYVDAIAPAERELAIRQKAESADVNLDDARTDLGVALVRSKRDVTRGRALLREAREDFVRLGSHSRLEDIDGALAVKP
jgi:eukaryotic-like serine/threonine-protein kinase